MPISAQHHRIDTAMPTRRAVLRFLVPLPLALLASGARPTRAEAPPDLAVQAVDGAAVAGIITEWRSWIGLPGVIWDDELAQSALVKAAGMAVCNYFSHDPAHPACPAPWPAQHNGECLAAGQQIWIEALLAWQSSPGHYATLRDPAFVRVGMAGVYEPDDTWRPVAGHDSMRYYWALRLAQ